jgi:hypothetical protein
MVAALVRLLHSGPQDMRLLPKDGPRDVGAYVRVLTRAGRFTTQWQRLDFQQKPQFGTQATCRILRFGELLTRLLLVVTLPDIYSAQARAIAAAGAGFRGPRFGWTNSIGHALIQRLTVEIGGTRVEEIDTRLLEILDEFDTPLEKVISKNLMIGRLQNGFTETSLGNSPTPLKVYIPLPLWFSRGDLGAALPIDAIHVDEIRVSIQFRPLTGVYYTDSRTPASAVDGSLEGSALWPITGSSFYQTDAGGSVVPGLALNKTPVTALVKPVQGIMMPLSYDLGDTYLLGEYIYLDKPEANRFRLAEIELPLIQHVPIPVRDTRGFPTFQVPLELANPTRHLYWMAQNWYAPAYNAFFLGTRDLSGVDTPYAPWWPDCTGLNTAYVAPLVPGFSTRGSEPFSLIELIYEGSYVRTSTENCAMYRSILPSYEERKSPWLNRYMYCLPFATQSGYYPPSVCVGEANMNRIMKKELRFAFGAPVKRLWLFCYAQTYNILKVYGGRATMLFGY